VCQPDQPVRSSLFPSVFRAADASSAWLLTGRAIRYSIAVGFHLRSDPVRLSEAEREKRYRAWWSLYSLDRLLSIMTGRPAMTSLGDFSTPLPRPVLEEDLERFKGDLPRTDMAQVLRNPAAPSESDQKDSGASPKRRAPQLSMTALEATTHGMETLSLFQANDAVFFRCQIQLDLVTHSIFSGLYRIIDHTRLIALNQESPITEIEAKLQAWLQALPRALDFTRPQQDASCARAAIRLGFSYYSAKIILYRPCLCDPARKAFEKPKPKSVANTLAQDCIKAASSMLAMVDDIPNALDLYSTVPWFAMVHYVMQAVSVILTEIDLKAHHLPQHGESLLLDAKKAIMLLYRLAVTSDVAAKAFDRAHRFLRKVAPSLNGNVDDLPSVPPQRFATHTPPLSSHLPQTAEMMPTPISQENDWFGNRYVTDSHFYTSPVNGPIGSMGMDLSFGAPMVDYNDPRTWPPSMPNVMMTELGYSDQDLGVDYGTTGGKYENGVAVMEA
jgi:hypothetical protein